jgi:hypothetical protein
MSKIELRLSSVNPPTPEPKRTIYRDIVNLPDPAKLGLTIRYFNHDDVDLYFQITGLGTGYTFGTVNLGLLGSGADAYVNLDEFASRAKPSASDLPNGEMEENITLILKAYTDSGYTNLKWTYERIVTVHWINSADPAFTVDVLNNFDDGTVQGWAVADIENNYLAEGYPKLEVVTDYVLSSPYSVRMGQATTADPAYVSARLYKSFTTPNKNVVYAIIDLRIRKADSFGAYMKQIFIRRDGTVLVALGKEDTLDTHNLPENKWMRIVTPLPPNTTLTVEIVHRYRRISGASYAYMWMDDFKIISK